MTEITAVDRDVEIQVVNSTTIRYVGNGVDANGDVHVLPGYQLRFRCTRPFALFIKKYLTAGNDPTPFDDDGSVYCPKGNSIEVTPKVKSSGHGNGHVSSGDKYSFGVAWLNADGIIQLHDPRILID